MEIKSSSALPQNQILTLFWPILIQFVSYQHLSILMFSSHLSLFVPLSQFILTKIMYLVLVSPSGSKVSS